jgi:hypothetical protein
MRDRSTSGHHEIEWFFSTTEARCWNNTFVLEVAKVEERSVPRLPWIDGMSWQSLRQGFLGWNQLTWRAGIAA